MQATNNEISIFGNKIAQQVVFTPTKNKHIFENSSSDTRPVSRLQPPTPNGPGSFYDNI